MPAVLSHEHGVFIPEIPYILYALLYDQNIIRSFSLKTLQSSVIFGNLK